MSKHIDWEIKYRPQTLDNLVGNSVIKKQLKGFAKKGMPHTILLTGGFGMGKTSVARIIQNILNCNNFDFKEYTATNDRGIDFSRKLVKDIKLAPRKGNVQILFLDEFHDMTKQAYGALLKALEEPPVHSYFILATKQVDKIPKDVLSRCTKLNLKPLKAVEIARDVLHPICEKEHIEVSKKVLNAIGKACDGSSRDAIVMLYQVQFLSEEEALKEIPNMTLHEDVVKHLGYLLLYKKPTRNEIINNIKAMDVPAESIRRQLLKYLENQYYKTGQKDEIRMEISFLSYCFSEPYHEIGNEMIGLLMSIEQYFRG